MKHLSFKNESQQSEQIDVFVYNTVVDVWSEKNIQSYPRKKIVEIKESLLEKGFNLIES